MRHEALVLSLFPGIGMLDMAFEEEGFTVVRGPDVLWGGDIRTFHPPAGKFDGIIGGPPCQAFSSLAALVRAKGHEPKFGNMIPEFERCIEEAQPSWFVMENVKLAPTPAVAGYVVKDQMLNNRWLGEEQQRLRRFSFGTGDGRPLIIDGLVALEQPVAYRAVTAQNTISFRQRDSMEINPKVGGPVLEWKPANIPVTGGGGALPSQRPKLVKEGGTVTASARSSAQGTVSKKGIATYTLARMCELQGLPPDFLDDAPFTSTGKRKAVGNGVPLPMGRAIARAVKEAMGY